MVKIPTFHQKHVNDFWRGANGITPQTPYDAEVEVEDGEVFPGKAVFSMSERGMIAECSLDSDDELLPHKLQADSNTTLRVPQFGFEGSVHVYRVPGITWTQNRPSGNPQIGFVVDKVDLPWTSDELSHFVVGASGIPDFWYDDAMFKYGTTDRGKDVDKARLGSSMIPRMTIESDEWWIRVAKLNPIETDDESDDTHRITIQMKDGGSDRSEYDRFFEQFSPLLKFIFGSTPALSIGVGYASGGGASWGQVYNSKPLAGTRNNWFSKLGSSQREFDLDQMLTGYLNLIHSDPNNDSVFRKLFHHYAVSEHFLSLGLVEMAFNASFAALEGMCKFILSTPSFKGDQAKFITLDQGDAIGRFKSQQTEKGMRHVVDAMVSAITNGESNQLTIPEKNKNPHVIDVLNSRRNETVHLELDERAGATSIRDYQLWNASQYVFELLALSILNPTGKFLLPDRTNPGKHEIMGKDMLAHLRSGQVKFSSRPAKKT